MFCIIYMVDHGNKLVPRPAIYIYFLSVTTSPLLFCGIVNSTKIYCSVRGEDVMLVFELVHHTWPGDPGHHSLRASPLVILR